MEEVAEMRDCKKSFALILSAVALKFGLSLALITVPIALVGGLLISWLLHFTNMYGLDQTQWAEKHEPWIVKIHAAISIVIASLLMPMLVKYLQRIPIIRNILSFADSVLNTAIHDSAVDRGNIGNDSHTSE